MKVQRHQYIDVIRVMGMFFVVLLHTSAEKLRMYIGSPGWHIVNMTTSLAATAVPLFFMASGAVILSAKETEDYSYVLKRRIPRLFWPLLAWSAVSVTMEYAVGTLTGADITAAGMIDKMTRFFVSPVRIHFWFMYTLIPLSLVSPMLKSVVQNRRNLKYAAVLFGVIALLGSLMPILPAQFSFIPDITFIRGAGFGMFVYYLLLGYLLHTMSRRVDTRVLAVVAVAAWVVICTGTYWKSRGGVYSEIFISYTGVYNLVLSAALFLLFKNLVTKPSRIVQALAPLSFGVYLVHAILIAVWLRLLPVLGLSITWQYVIGSFCVTSILSCAITWVLSKFRVTAYVFCGIRKRKA